jgi:hypothetical protein
MSFSVPIEFRSNMVVISNYCFKPFLLLCFLIALPLPTCSQPKSGTAATPTQQRDGQHDFDFEFGAWKIQLKRLVKPLTSSTSWLEYSGTSVVRKVWDGKANLGELEVSGATGRIEGLSLRTYNPQSHQWHIGWVNSADGTMGPAMIGAFKNGRGEFFNQESFNGRAIFVRFIFSDITANTFHFEQAFSDDGGKTWEVNWVANFTRVKDSGR